MTKLTALIITYNEIVHVDELISNISFADECIIVDSYSTDGTFEKLKTYDNVKVHQREFKNFADQKNFALSLASNDWVLFLDADERLTEEGINEVRKTINGESEFVAYWARFQYYFGEKPIKFSGFQTAKSYRLFKKSKCQFDTQKAVHEALIVNGESSTLKNKIIHYSFRDYNHYKEKMSLYAHLKAKKLFENGKTSSFFKKTFKPLYRFFNHYVIRLGILDGKVGYHISVLNAYEVTERFRKLDQLNREAKS